MEQVACTLLESAMKLEDAGLNSKRKKSEGKKRVESWNAHTEHRDVPPHADVIYVTYT